MSIPLVTISCITYNHVAFIGQCIESFLMQQTTFKFEVLINDDASTDGTQEVIKRYEELYPDIVKPVYQKENQYSKGKRMINFRYNIPRAKGKYIALCEGDDYWTDPLKLQKQVDFLQANDGFTLCFTNRKVLRDGKLEDQITNDQSVFTLKDIVGGFIPYTQTLLLRNDTKLISFLNKHLDCSSGDRLLAFYSSLIGDIKKLPDVTSVYRVHDGGVWSGFGKNFDSALVSIERLIRFKKDIVEPEIGLESNHYFLSKLVEKNIKILKKYGFINFVKAYFKIIKDINIVQYTYSFIKFIVKRFVK